MHGNCAIARSGTALSFPRKRLLVRSMFWFENTMRKLRRNQFRTFIHPVRAIESQLNASGFVLRSVRHTSIWRVALFEPRAEPTV
jgi:hypothetical protein